MTTHELALLESLEARRVAWHMASLLGVGTPQEQEAWAAYQRAIALYHTFVRLEA